MPCDMATTITTIDKSQIQWRHCPYVYSWHELDLWIYIEYSDITKFDSIYGVYQWSAML